MHSWTAQNLFEAFFRPLYPELLRHDDRALIHARRVDANPARNPKFLSEISEIAQTFARLAPHALSAPSLVLDGSDESIHRLGATLHRTTRDALFHQSKPNDPTSLLVSIVLHGSMYVGSCIVNNHGGQWSLRQPLWESVVHLKSFLGEGAISPFHWWLKALSDHEIDRDGLTARYRQFVERATLDLTHAPKLISKPQQRMLPPLKIVRYDTLHKYLRAHVPELKDVGQDFPTAEAFTKFGFLELEFLILGEGQYVLMHGRGKQGLHLFWFDVHGFSHARFFPATPGDAHSIEVDGNRLRVRFMYNQIEQTHEMLWWG